MAPCWGRCGVEFGPLFIEVRRWWKSPCQVKSKASAFESAIKRFDDRLIESDDFFPGLGRSDVNDQVECLVRSFYTAEPAAEWADCEVQRNRTQRESESNTEEIVGELTGDFPAFMIPFDCFTVLSPEDRRPLWDCFVRSTRDYRNLLEIGGNHLQAHRLASRGGGEVRCDIFVGQVEDAVERIVGDFTETIELLEGNVRLRLQDRFRELTTARSYGIRSSLSRGSRKALEAGNKTRREDANFAKKAAIAELLRRHADCPDLSKSAILSDMALAKKVGGKAPWGSKSSLMKHCLNVNFKRSKKGKSPTK